ncbi:hypothetical protein PV646_12915 [Streptomyces sp. ID05-26A]|nr:hypothetical protein [Streptomyces sp. ID05-26A]
MRARRDGEGATEPEDGEPAADQHPLEQPKILVTAVSRWNSPLEETGRPDARPLRPAKVLVPVAGVLAAATVVTLVILYPFGTPTAGPGSSSSASTTTTTQVIESSTGSPTTTTSAGGVPITTPLTGTSSSSSRTSDPTTTTTPPPGGAAPGADADRPMNVQEQRVVELVPLERYNWVDIEYWRHDTASPGEVQMDGTGVHTAVGAQLAIVADTPLAGRARCAQVTSWRDRVEFTELHAGSQLCGRSRAGRYASLEVRTLPASPSSDGKFIFYGITWN